MLILLSLGYAGTAKAETKPPTNGTPVKGEKVDVDALKKRYWAKGESTEMQVVQNRYFTKGNKFELQAFGGFVSTDPFLSAKNYGGTLGYYFSEYFGVRGMYWKYAVSSSSAADQFIASQNGVIYPDTNEPRDYYGGEVLFSPIYGKLSVLGSTIIYYDFHLMGGVGIVKSESASDMAVHLGVGQQIYLSEHFALNVDYRILRNNEQLLHKSPSNRGQKAISRENYSNILSIGVSLLL